MPLPSKGHHTYFWRGSQPKPSFVLLLPGWIPKVQLRSACDCLHPFGRVQVWRDRRHHTPLVVPPWRWFFRWKTSNDWKKMKLDKLLFSGMKGGNWITEDWTRLEVWVLHEAWWFCLIHASEKRVLLHCIVHSFHNISFFLWFFSSQTPFWTPKPPSLTFVYFWPSSHFPGTVKHRWTLENCCRKTVVPNFGGMVDHYEHDSAAYAVPWRASFGGLLVNLYGLIAGSLDFFLLDCNGKPFWIIKAPRPVAISFFSNFEC